MRSIMQIKKKFKKQKRLGQEIFSDVCIVKMRIHSV